MFLTGDAQQIGPLLLLLLFSQSICYSSAWSWLAATDRQPVVIYPVSDKFHDVIIVGDAEAKDAEDSSIRWSLRPDRRQWFVQFAPLVLLIPLDSRQAASAATTTETAPGTVARAFARRTTDFAYDFTPPPGFTAPSQKPIKTHLDEVNFKSDDDATAQFGITVDPLRIGRLAEFGTPEEVAAKVVLAELNRDGVFDVTLMEDPFAAGGTDGGGDNGGSTLFYQLNYRSNGKRGVKRYVAKFYIRDQKLFALTAQCGEDEYEAKKDDILKAVASFQILPLR